jgi:uncharacterized protein YdaL
LFNLKKIIIMEVLYIALGIVSSIFIFLLGYSVNGVFNIQKKVIELQERTNIIDVNLGQIEEHIHIRINTAETELQRNIDSLEREFNSVLDSRIDKLEHRVSAKIPPTNEEVMTQLLNLKEEFLTLRKNL